jgi:ribosomal protein L11 methyltransferase
MQREYVELEIIGDPALFEDLTGLMLQRGFEGFWEEGNILKGYMNMERWSDACLLASLPRLASGSPRRTLRRSGPDRQGVLEEIRRAVNLVAQLHGLPLPKIQTKTIEYKNWNEAWEKTIQPIQVTERIVITPTWHKYVPSPGQIVLTIDPKMSFGTGYHETTRLMLKLMEKHCKPGMNVLDVGTGTGVLAIAAVKLGAESAVGVDNDQWAYKNALENVRLNGATGRVQIILGDVASVNEQPFDMIVANIQRNVLLEIINEMCARLEPNGLLLLSGLLLDDERPMIDALHNIGFRMIEELIENEWIALAAHLSA